jgi:hypothetical protein
MWVYIHKCRFVEQLFAKKGKQIVTSSVIYIDITYAHHLKYEILAAIMKIVA